MAKIGSDLGPHLVSPGRFDWHSQGDKGHFLSEHIAVQVSINSVCGILELSREPCSIVGLH